jgi:hypothetical protein
MTDAFSKYVELVKIQNKEADTLEKLMQQKSFKFCSKLDLAKFFSSTGTQKKCL